MVYPESEPKDTKYLLKVIVKRQESLYKLSEQSGSPKTTEQNHKKSLEQKIQFSQTEHHRPRSAKWDIVTQVRIVKIIRVL